MDNEKPHVEMLAQRESYIAAVQKIAAGDSLELRDIQETLNWLQSASAIHKPDNMEQHLGVMFIVLSPDRKQTFMLNHRKAQLWLPPGGHVDRGLSFQEAVSAEMLEELKCEAVFITPFPFFLTTTLTRGINAGHIDVTAWFLVEGDPTRKYEVLEKEASEAKWVLVEDLLSMPERSNLPRAYRKMQEFIR